MTDADTSVSKDQTLVESPIIVPLPAFVSEAAINPQPISVAIPLTSSETTLNLSEPEQIIITYSNAKKEQPIQIVTTLDSSSPFVLESVYDAPFVSPNLSNAPSTSTRNTPQPTNVSPPTFLLDSIILKEVCENIFKDLNKLVKTRNNFVHKVDYVKEWTVLRERVDYVMCELHKTSLEAHDKALNTLNEWFTKVVKNMEEVYVNRDQEKNKLYISDTPIFMDASSIITASVLSENPDIRWLTKLKIQTDAPILEKLKKDSVLERENKKLKKDLFEQRILCAELQRKMIAHQEEAKVREEALMKSYSDLKEAMEKQSDKTNNMMQEMLELMKKQAKP
jgi:hypothetical protein